MRIPLLVALLSLAGPALAEQGTVGGATLRRPLGARAVGMAEAFCAVDGGLDSLSYNAAGMSGLKKAELRTDFSRGLADDSFGYLAYAQTIKKVTLAAGAAYYDAGSVTLNLSDGTRETRKVQQDWVGSLGASVALPAGFSAGAVAKYYRFELGQQARAGGAAFDAGARWQSPLPGLSLGAAIQNVGSDVKFEQEGDPLPRTARAGAAYVLQLERPETLGEAVIKFTRFLFTADAISHVNEPMTAAAGLEMQMPFGDSTEAALRVGYGFNQPTTSLSAGIGVTEGRFIFDYALALRRELTHEHHFSIGVRL